VQDIIAVGRDADFSVDQVAGGDVSYPTPYRELTADSLAVRLPFPLTGCVTDFGKFFPSPSRRSALQGTPKKNAPKGALLSLGDAQ
jgi:hypothetical protein